MLEIPVTSKCIPILYIPTDQSNTLVQHRSSKELPHKSIGKSILFAHQIAILELLHLYHINRIDLLIPVNQKFNIYHLQ